MKRDWDERREEASWNPDPCRGAAGQGTKKRRGWEVVKLVN